MYYIIRTEFSIIFSDEIPSFERKSGLCKMRVIYNNHINIYGHRFPYRPN